ncbi:response regulator receiver protein [Geobacter metallireducens RCH3]|uniref:Response receiver CheY n=1 Tax=Geobacter metallireducens (strain ATCC 53774 / DSM 7210 / GS-15) TaxID=269799 RepID=Q39XK4_GEOMG|nr:response regulator [Geobacter metallireducens]ABB31020.1 response receiver CheY [Geobacter metallireducens GS-15]EHP86026.1 response regulator receiver protein [Geobacter metallireducens RCH3]
MEPARNPAKSINILFVEDDRYARELIPLMISNKFPGVAIILADNGESGLELCRANEFDIVITDINMPDMDGIRMAGEIRGLKPDAKIIVMSGYSEKCYFDQLQDIGITDYILKPVDTKLLFLAIGKFIDQVMLKRHRPAVIN